MHLTTLIVALVGCGVCLYIGLFGAFEFLATEINEEPSGIDDDDEAPPTSVFCPNTTLTECPPHPNPCFEFKCYDTELNELCVLEARRAEVCLTSGSTMTVSVEDLSPGNCTEMELQQFVSDFFTSLSDILQIPIDLFQLLDAQCGSYIVTYHVRDRLGMTGSSANDTADIADLINNKTSTLAQRMPEFASNQTQITQSPTRDDVGTLEPTASPTVAPTASPSGQPTQVPTKAPTGAPSEAPTEHPSTAPTEFPTKAPSESPTKAPTESPTPPTPPPSAAPTGSPTKAPSEEPTRAPTKQPTKAPSEEPTRAPTEQPTKAPSEEPTRAPTEQPTVAPTEQPTVAPTEQPSAAPTEQPSKAPTESPTVAPTTSPSLPVYNFTESDGSWTSVTGTGCVSGPATTAVWEISNGWCDSGGCSGDVAGTENTRLSSPTFTVTSGVIDAFRITFSHDLSSSRMVIDATLQPSKVSGGVVFIVGDTPDSETTTSCNATGSASSYVSSQNPSFPATDSATFLLSHLDGEQVSIDVSFEQTLPFSPPSGFVVEAVEMLQITIPQPQFTTATSWDFSSGQHGWVTSLYTGCTGVPASSEMNYEGGVGWTDSGGSSASYSDNENQMLRSPIFTVSVPTTRYLRVNLDLHSEITFDMLMFQIETFPGNAISVPTIATNSGFNVRSPPTSRADCGDGAHGFSSSSAVTGAYVEFDLLANDATNISVRIGWRSDSAGSSNDGFIIHSVELADVLITPEPTPSPTNIPEPSFSAATMWDFTIDQQGWDASIASFCTANSPTYMQYVPGVGFTDSGGSSADYASLENSRLVSPVFTVDAVARPILRLEFADFATETGYDYLMVEMKQWPSGTETAADHLGGSTGVAQAAPSGHAECFGRASTAFIGTGSGATHIEIDLATYHAQNVSAVVYLRSDSSFELSGFVLTAAILSNTPAP